MIGNLPIEGKAEAKVEISNQTIKNITDHKNFAPNTSKIEEIGRIFKKTFAIICDGQGRMSFIRMDGKSLKSYEITREMSDLKKVHDQGLISDEDFEEIRKTMVKQLKNIWK